MSWMAKAALAAALLNCGLLNVSAQDTSNNGQWLKDGGCSLFSAGAGPGDTVQWTGACVGGYFIDGKLDQKSGAPADARATTTPLKESANAPGAPFGGVSGKTLIGVDGSSIVLTVIEGGMEMQVVPASGLARKTTFTFMT